MTRVRHALAALLAALLTPVLLVGLVGCAGAQQPQAIRPTAAAAVQRAIRDEAGARLLNDDRSASLVVVPKHSNGALAVFVHGWSQTRWSLLQRGPEAGVARALLGDGFTVLAADGGGKAWGDPTSVADYRSLIARTESRYRLRDVFLMGESMGGLATMRLARTVSDVRAVVAWYPVCDLRTMRQQRFRASIDEAWPRRQRSAVSPVAVSGKPMLVWASAGDTVVPAVSNAAVCVDEARHAGAMVSYTHTTGDHGDPSNFDPTAVLAFFEQHRSPGA